MRQEGIEPSTYGLRVRKKCACEHKIKNPMQAYVSICYHLLGYKFEYKVEYKSILLVIFFIY